MDITVSQKVSLERIADLLCSALEGGSNYWYMIQDKVEPKIWSIDERPVYKDKETARKNINVHYLHYYPLNEGGALMIDDERADDPELKKPVRLDLERVKKGVELFASSKEYAHHYRDFIQENEDAITADVFLQFCIFGEVIYG